MHPRRPRQTVISQGISFATTIQAEVTVRVNPEASIFTDRIRYIELLKSQFVQEAIKEVPGTKFSSHYVWMEGLGPSSYLTRQLQPVFIDDCELSRGSRRIGGGGRPADAEDVFSSFSGRAARLPDGYYVVWTTTPGIDMTNSHPLSRTLIRSGATKPLTAEECREVLRRTYAHANRGVRFAGIALGNYDTSTTAQDGAGIAALQSGRCTLENTSGETLLKGQLVCWEFPGMGDVLYIYGNNGDARPRLKRYVAKTVARAAMRDGFRRLLFEAATIGESPAPVITDRPSQRLWRRADGADPAPAVPPKDEAELVGAVMSEDICQKMALQFIHAVEAAVRFVMHVQNAPAATAQLTKQDSTFFGLPSMTTADGGKKINLVRAFIAEAMRAVPPASEAQDVVSAIPTGLQQPDLQDPIRAYFDTLANLSPALSTPGNAGYEVPFATVIVGAKRNQPVDVLLL